MTATPRGNTFVCASGDVANRHFDESANRRYPVDVMRIVTMNTSGRLTLPAETRRALGLEGSAEFEVEIDPESDALILRPAIVLRREDAWAYTPEHRALLAKAHKDSREGRVRRMTESQLLKLGKKGR
jgi:bifunctional DNA-binding transcriptional regulator/antitoxin component of YhaV-PrlF toxin-antitoxin module